MIDALRPRAKFSLFVVGCSPDVLYNLRKLTSPLSAGIGWYMSGRRNPKCPDTSAQATRAIRMKDILDERSVLIDVIRSNKSRFSYNAFHKDVRRIGSESLS